MRSHKDILEEFCELGESKVTLSLYDGTYYEGYIFDILDKTFRFFMSGPMAPDEPIQIGLNDVDLNSLCYYDESEFKWKSAVWEDKNGTWKITDWTHSKS